MVSARRPAAPAERSAPAVAEAKVPPYERIKKAIVDGDLKPGDPLVETTLAAWCEVSRTPVREALRRLEQDGLVERNDRGLVVRRRSPDEILDIYVTRIALEATAARVAAERRTEHDLRTLHRLVERARQIRQGDTDAMVEVNNLFHRTVWRASRNESLIDMLERLNLHMARYPGTTLNAPGRWKAARRQHEEIVAAIEGRDGDAAHDIAMRHFSDARDIRLDLFADDVS